MLDTYCLCELWRRQFGLPEFSLQLISKIGAATKWLQQMTDVETGYAPNMGANDGARILALVDSDYRDCRPSLQLAAALFCGARAIESIGLWDQALYWHGLETNLPTLTVPISQSLDYGGTHVLRSGRAVCYMRYPRFRFRPSQADCLHVDLWREGKNLLKDAGTYSYNSSADEKGYFKSTAAHNTVQIDGRDQMPSISRFLFGNWLKAQDVELVSQQSEVVSAAAGYRDSVGAKHFRRIELSPNKLICIDKVYGYAHEAVLRWRLADGDWSIDGDKASNGDCSISLSSEGQPMIITLAHGFESSYYLDRSNLTVLEIKFKLPAVITSIIEF